MKLLPVRLGIMRLGRGWRLLLSIAVMAGYMIASRVIYNAADTTLVAIETLRTPFRLAAALMYWLLMADVIFSSRLDAQSLRSRTFMAGLLLALAIPLLVAVEPMSRQDALIVALATIPVALNEELFFRGILQTLLVKKLGAFMGVALASILFTLSHIGVGPRDTTGFLLVGLAGVFWD